MKCFNPRSDRSDLCVKRDHLDCHVEIKCLSSWDQLSFSSLEKEMATHSSTLAWKIPWTEEPVSYSPRACKESDTTEYTHTHTHTHTSAHDDLDQDWLVEVG